MKTKMERRRSKRKIVKHHLPVCRMRILVVSGRVADILRSTGDEDAVSYGAGLDPSHHDGQQLGVVDLAHTATNADAAVRGQSYRSRVEQVLREDPDTDIMISHAGNSHGGRGRGFIVYTIQTAVCIRHAMFVGDV